MAKSTYLSPLKVALSRIDQARTQGAGRVKSVKSVISLPLAARELVDGPSEPDESPAVLEFGCWAEAEPPEAPPPPDDGLNAEYWGWPPLAPAADFYQPGECRPSLFRGPVGYPLVLSDKSAKVRLVAHVEAVKEYHRVRGEGE